MEYSEEKLEEIGNYFKATEVMRMINIHKKDQPEVRSKKEDGSIESKRNFEGNLSKNIFFSGAEKLTTLTNKSQNKIKSLMFIARDDFKCEPLCSIYERFIFDYSKSKSVLKTSVIIETPNCSKSNFVNTRFEGKQTKDNQGVLNVIHAPEEDPRVFIDNLYNTVCRSSEKIKNINKLRKFNKALLGDMLTSCDIQRSIQNVDGFVM